jgi:hypothetical protein
VTVAAGNAGTRDRKGAPGEVRLSAMHGRYCMVVRCELVSAPLAAARVLAALAWAAGQRPAAADSLTSC